jgi:hypothetical protein
MEQSVIHLLLLTGPASDEDYVGLCCCIQSLRRHRDVPHIVNNLARFFGDQDRLQIREAAEYLVGACPVEVGEAGVNDDCELHA